MFAAGAGVGFRLPTWAGAPASSINMPRSIGDLRPNRLPSNRSERETLCPDMPDKLFKSVFPAPEPPWNTS